MSVAIYYYYVLTTRRYDDALSTKKVLTSISWYDLNAGRDATRDEFFPVPGLSDITFILHAYWRWTCSGVWGSGSVVASGREIWEECVCDACMHVGGSKYL